MSDNNLGDNLELLQLCFQLGLQAHQNWKSIAQ